MVEGNPASRREAVGPTGVLVATVLALLACLAFVAGQHAALRREALQHGHAVIRQDSGFRWIEPQTVLP